MTRFAQLSIRRKLVLVISATSAFAALLTALGIGLLDTRAFRHQAVQDLQALAEVLGEGVAGAVKAGNAAEIDRWMTTLHARPSIRSARLYDMAGRRIGGYGVSKPDEVATAPGADGAVFSTRTFTVTHTLTGHASSAAPFARLVIESDLGELRARQSRHLTLLVVMTVSLLGASVLVGHWLQRGISGPVASLARTVRCATERPDYSARVPISSRDEIGQLTGAFNRMLDAVQNREAALRASEERYTLVVQGSNAGIWDWNLKSNQVSFSPRFMELLGFASGEAVWTTPESLIERMHPADREQTLAMMRAHGEHREVLDIECRLRTQSGGYRWFQVRGQSIRDDAGIPVRTAGSLTDITETKRAQDLLRETQEMARVGGWEVNLATRQVTWTDEVYRIHGLPVGRPITWEEALAFYSPESRQEVEGFLGRAGREGRGWDAELRLRTAEGRQIWVRLQAGVTLEEGRPMRLAGTIQDVTERRLAEDALRKSEERYRSLTESAYVGILVRQDGLLKYANPAAARLFGCTGPSEMIGRPNADFVAPEYLDELEARTNSVLRGETVPTHPGWRVRRADGRETWVQSGGTLFQWEGRPALLVFLTDVTERRLAQEALRASEERFIQFMQNLPGPVHMLDDHLRFVHTNDAFRAVFGLDDRSWPGRVPREVLAAEVADRWSEAAEWVLTQNRPLMLQETVTNPAGRLHFLTHRFPIRIAGRALLVGGVSIDIGDRVRAEEEVRILNADLERRVSERTEELRRRVVEFEELNRSMMKLLEDVQEARTEAEAAARQLRLANAQLDAANQELESFSYSVSHDLRAPLRNVSGFVGLLRRGLGEGLDAESRRFMSTIDDEVRRMSTLIDSLLSLSRIGRAEMHLQPVDPTEIVQESRAELGPDIQGRAVVWEIDVLPEVRADRSLLRLVFQNLIGNAVKFTRGRNPARIHVGTRPPAADATEIVFFVRDNGAGFNMKYAHKLFGVFQRLHSARQFEGTGIGLANVQRIIHRHGGRVWAEGEEGNGATFFFSLPTTQSG